MMKLLQFFARSYNCSFVPKLCFTTVKHLQRVDLLILMLLPYARSGKFSVYSVKLDTLVLHYMEEYFLIVG